MRVFNMAEEKEEKCKSAKSSKCQLKRKAGTIKNILAWFFFGAIIALVLFIADNTFNSNENTATNKEKFNFVSFDTAKYINARRAHTAQLFKTNLTAEQEDEVTSVILKADRSAREVIEKFAEGRVVLVAQSLALTDQIPDITNDVITHLGLDPNVPTYKTKVDDLDQLGTTFDQGEAYKSLLESYKEREKEATQAIQQHETQRQKEGIEKWIP